MRRYQYHSNSTSSFLKLLVRPSKRRYPHQPISTSSFLKLLITPTSEHHLHHLPDIILSNKYHQYSPACEVKEFIYELAPHPSKSKPSHSADQRQEIASPPSIVVSTILQRYEYLHCIRQQLPEVVPCRCDAWLFG